MATWPITLPTEFLVAGYTHQSANNRIKSQVDIGPAKIRKRQTKSVEKISASMVLDRTQMATFRTFYDTDTESGSLTFDFDDPITDSTVTMRFDEPPSWTSITPQLFRLNLSLELIQ